MDLPKFYEMLWTRIGGRPWTFIWQDVWHKYEFIPQSVFFWLGVLIAWLSGIDIGFTKIMIIFLAYGWGYLNGHFHFGKPYIPNQQGKPTAE